MFASVDVNSEKPTPPSLHAPEAILGARKRVAYIVCMQAPRELNSVPDDELLLRLAALLQSSRQTEADLVAHIGEVDARRLYAREAAPSMWAYCTERLHLSAAEAYLRIAAARASREHPVILQMLADGRLHLSAIAKLAPHLTPANRDVLLGRATHKSKREVEELLARSSRGPMRRRSFGSSRTGELRAPNRQRGPARRVHSLPLEGAVRHRLQRGEERTSPRRRRWSRRSTRPKHRPLAPLHFVWTKLSRTLR